MPEYSRWATEELAIEARDRGGIVGVGRLHRDELQVALKLNDIQGRTGGGANRFLADQLLCLGGGGDNLCRKPAHG